MQRIDVHRDDFQRELFAFEGFSIDFHLDGRQRIDIFVETRDGQAARTAFLTIVGIGGIAFDGQQFHTWHQIRLRFPIGKHHLRPFVSRHRHRDVRLLTDENANRVDFLLDENALCLRLQQRERQHSEYE